ncbi:MAG TPA: 3-methyl-2-oxobutanoate hydroxymethyltransferase [Myxococcales bacterium]|nr:3-methyl-2-oxobutanoate hydroxymethyltransferase [Myxococcales bacterium]HIN85771.1 3-methyl-2-oxobutanoate hydroxymethyltransferase [Myxococcales bacterium]
MRSKKITTTGLRAMKERGEQITMLTAYDATFARLLDRSGIDILLVGDSLGMVIQGHDSTIPVTLDEMIYHCRAVVRGRGDGRSHVVGDLPFMSYQINGDEALRNAGRLIKEGAVESVKLEGGARVAESVSRMVAAGIPVMGHLGLTPQSVHQLGGWKVQGKSDEDADRIVDDAICLEQAGAYALVLETVPAHVARRVTEALSIPTIGIGAGPECDGQVLVIYDLLGLSPEFNPKFLKKYASLGMDVMRACKAFSAEVKEGAFPAAENCY